MKNYTRKQISTDDIDAYSMCPKFYELSKDNVKPVDESDDEKFRRCVKEAMLQMYIMELSTGHKAEFHSVKSFWDKIFWKAFSDKTLATKALEYSERGLDILSQYHGTVYSMSHNKIAAVKAPYDYLMHCEKVAVPVEIELVLVDSKRSDVYFVSFVDAVDKASIKKEAHSLAKHLIKMSAIHKETPSHHATKATFYNAEHNTGYTVEITDEMVNSIDRSIGQISSGIHNKIFYKSRTAMCDSCVYIKECDSGGV